MFSQSLVIGREEGTTPGLLEVMIEGSKLFCTLSSLTSYHHRNPPARAALSSHYLLQALCHPYSSVNYKIVLEWCLEGDGRPRSIPLIFATPRHPPPQTKSPPRNCSNSSVTTPPEHTSSCMRHKLGWEGQRKNKKTNVRANQVPTPVTARLVLDANRNQPCRITIAGFIETFNTYM